MAQFGSPHSVLQNYPIRGFCAMVKK